MWDVNRLASPEIKENDHLLTDYIGYTHARTRTYTHIHPPLRRSPTLDRYSWAAAAEQQIPHCLCSAPRIHLNYNGQLSRCNTPTHSNHTAASLMDTSRCHTRSVLGTLEGHWSSSDFTHFHFSVFHRRHVCEGWDFQLNYSNNNGVILVINSNNSRKINYEY